MTSPPTRSFCVGADLVYGDSLRVDRLQKVSTAKHIEFDSLTSGSMKDEVVISCVLYINVTASSHGSQLEASTWIVPSDKKSVLSGTTSL